MSLLNIQQMKKLPVVKLFEHWSVDRYGRLLSGTSMTVFILLGYLNVWFLGVSSFIGLALILTSLTDKCLMHDLLISLGAKEREELFLPGGILIASLVSQDVLKEESLKIDRRIQKRKPTATSQALTEIKREVDLDAFSWAVKDKTDYTIGVASNLDDRKRVFQLAQKVYGSCGYISDDGSSYCVLDYDIRKDTIIFMAKDMTGNVLGSITVVTDQVGELPCQEIFKDEVVDIKIANQSLVEITRLVIDDRCRNSKKIVKNLMNAIYIYAKNISQASDILIEVNPRHLGFYGRLLCFERYGDEKPCRRVEGAPAVLMRLPVALAEVKVLEGRDSQVKPKRKCLQHHFIGESEELNVDEMIRKVHQPMSVLEKQYFGLTDKQDYLISY